MEETMSRQSIVDRLLGHAAAFERAGARINRLRVEPWVYRQLFSEHSQNQSKRGPITSWYGIDLQVDGATNAYDFEVSYE